MYIIIGATGFIGLYTAEYFVRQGCEVLATGRNHKVEKYLECCLDSLCRQSLSDIEILLIDDGTLDKCGEF